MSKKTQPIETHENNQLENEIYLKLKEAENGSDKNNKRFSPKDVLCILRIISINDLYTQQKTIGLSRDSPCSIPYQTFSSFF